MLDRLGRVRLLRGVFCVFPVVSPLGGNALAQEVEAGTASGDPAETAGLAEIVVTAQKRVENLQDVPIAATAVSGEAVEKMQVVTIQGLSGKVPNVQISNFANTPNTAAVSIRGIGVIDADPYAGNTVSIIYDGVPQYFSMGALVDIYDVERVEVLRGPQGTLFGANTTGGAINITTAQPTGEFGGKAQVTVGNWNRFDVKGALEVPLVEDVLTSKIVFAHHERDGFVTNIVDGERMGGRNIELYRGYLSFTPSSNFEATLTGEYVEARNGTPMVVNSAYANELLYVPPGTQGMYESPCAPGRACKAPDKYLSANNSEPDQSDMTTHRETLTINVYDTPLGDLTSITGYKYFEILEYTDQDATPFDLLTTRRYTEGWQFSSELRSAFNVTDGINGIAGVFYLKDHYDSDIGTTLTFAGPGLLTRNLQDQDNWSISGFAQFDAQVTERLKLQAGIRYTHEETDMLASIVTSVDLVNPVSDYFGDDNFVVATVAPPRGQESWDKLGWKLGLDYDLGYDTLLYGYWARGFKSGGFAGRLGIPEDLGPFDPETVDTFELGLKTELLDRRVRINAAAFLTNYRDMQIATVYYTTVDGRPVQGNTIINAAKSEIKGFEFELALAPVRGLTINSFVSYLDSKYKDFPYIEQTTISPDNPTGTEINLAGLRLQNSPKWQASISAAYEMYIGDHTVTPSITYSHVGKKYFTQVRNTPRSTIQATNLVDANLTWTLPGDRLELTLWAQNLFDERYIAAVADTPGLNGFLAYQAPREMGVTAKVTF